MRRPCRPTAERVIEHVVVATDFSPPAAAAQDWGALVATVQDATLDLVHVVPPLPAPHEALTALPDLGARLVAAAQERLEELAAPHREAGLQVSCHVEVGPPWRVVLETARRLGAGLVVVGTRRHVAVSRFPLGSTAARIIQKADCPVLAVHPEDGRPTRVPCPILVPTDLSGDARRAAAHAIDLFGLAPGSSLLLVHAWTLPADYAFYEASATALLAAYGDEALAGARRRLERRAAELKGLGLAVEPLLREGPAADVIVEVAARHGAGLVAMCTHGLAGVERWLLGSVAQQVVQHAPCPVLTAPAL